MLYAAKCYWPGVSRHELDVVGERVARAAAAYRGSLLFEGDELVLCLFEDASPAAVRSACEQAGVPCERVMTATWIETPTRRGGTSR
jgi:hypothetical protein